jgi:hypothetical protein
MAGVKVSNAYAVTVEAYRRAVMGGPALLERAVAGLLETVPTATIIEVRVIDPGLGEEEAE